MNKILLILAALVIVSCDGPVENSSTTDMSQYGNIQDSGTPAFLAAKTIIRRDCAFCHRHAGWNSYQEADFVANGLVTPGDVNSSQVYYRNTNALSGPGPKNMPSGGYPAIGATDLETIATWINGI